MVELKEYQRSEVPNWCSGCGNFSILAGVKKALSELNIEPHNIVLVSGVGCFAKLPYWIKAYGFVGLHGRSLPVAQGIKLANPKLTVIAFGGDGDGYGEGGNHFIHACRRNLNVCYFVHNNGVFGLTTGQYSPTSEKGRKSKSSPLGTLEKPLNPLTLAISAGATFVARAYAGDFKQLVELMTQAIQHTQQGKGFAVVDILQPCVSFGKNYEYYQKRVYYLGTEHDATNKIKALEKALESGEKLGCGVIYEEP
ncbi:2-oxoacid ferredoxin oxidoreductase [Candidatus Woesearchaeota archaeon]|nr:2-oxoacid ferredoxin oxidoreductase [Candidatus Woesearchaeota archaeon]